MKRIISAVVQDRPGVLNRIASMFRRRGFNIASLSVGASEQAGFSRMTIVVDDVPPTSVDQVTKQLYNVIEVVKASDITDEEIVSRETALIKVRSTPATRGQVIEILDLFRGIIEIADVSYGSVIIEMTGATDQIESLLALLKPYGILEVMRTGQIALTRDRRAPD